jgi:predicted AlkP superfamily pyrophosphatase or phosphodiesterase
VERINIVGTDEFGNKALGWFDLDAAIRYAQGTEWDGHNTIGVITKSNFIDESLYRTKGGRWVRNRDATRYNSGPDAYEFLTDEEARDWLICSECNDDAIKQYFGELEEERDLGGRPEVGPAFSLRFPTELLTRVDAAAKVKGIGRAQAIRDAVEASLA